jgi:CHASE3 domain sensor protein
MGKLGAIASNNSQATRRSIKEILEELSTRTVTPEEAEEYGMEEGTSLLEAATLAQFRRAMKGDTKAAEYVRDTLGEKPTDKISAEIETITAEDRERIERILNRDKTTD